MAAAPDNDKGGVSAGRHVYGPRAVSALVPALVRPAFRKRNPAAAQVLADWEAIAGPALASEAMPRRLSGGTLSIACSGPKAMELQHQSSLLIERINTYLGRIAVLRLRLVQDPQPPPPARPSPPPPALRAAEAAVAGLPQGPLRDALEKLGRVVLGAPRET